MDSPRPSVFADFREHVYRHQWRATIEVDSLVGGVPTDPKKAEGWLRSKLGETKDDVIREMVAEVMVDRGVTAEEATELVVAKEHLNGFKRNASGLFVEGRQMKACVKESANIQWPQRRWGATNKGTKGFFAEHVFVAEDVLPIFAADGETHILEPTGIHQRFVHTWRGSGIQYEEYVEGAVVSFTVVSDFEFEFDDIQTLWVSAEQQGFGASRSQGFGRFRMIKWEQIETAGLKESRATTGKKSEPAEKAPRAKKAAATAVAAADNGHALVDA